MELALSLQEIQDFIKIEDHFYTEDELALLAKLENGELDSRSHEDVMATLKKALQL